MFSNSQENLESPFLDEEIFVKENEAEAEPHLETLQRESPFRYAFEEARAVRPEPEDLEEKFDEEEWVDEEDFFGTKLKLKTRRRYRKKAWRVRTMRRP